MPHLHSVGGVPAKIIKTLPEGPIGRSPSRAQSPPLPTSFVRLRPHQSRLSPMRENACFRPHIIISASAFCRVCTANAEPFVMSPLLSQGERRYFAIVGACA